MIEWTRLLLGLEDMRPILPTQHTSKLLTTHLFWLLQTASEHTAEIWLWWIKITSILARPLKMAIKQSRDQTPSAGNSPLTGMDLGGNVSTHLPLLFHSGWGSQHRNLRNLIIEKRSSRQMKARTQGMGCQGREPGCANQDSRKEAVSAELDWLSTTSALWRDWNVAGPEASYFISGSSSPPGSHSFAHFCIRTNIS